jgi:hypothetical protein
MDSPGVLYRANPCGDGAAAGGAACHTRAGTPISQMPYGILTKAAIFQAYIDSLPVSTGETVSMWNRLLSEQHHPAFEGENKSGKACFALSLRSRSSLLLRRR